MKRWSAFTLYRYSNGKIIEVNDVSAGGSPLIVILASEVDEVIMNMVDEFAETAKEYESDRAKDKEEIVRLRKALEYYGDSNIYFADGGALAREALAEKEIVEPDDKSIGEGDVITYIGP